MSSAPAILKCPACQVPLDHRLLKEHRVSGCPRCHTIALPAKSLMTAKSGLVGKLAAAAFTATATRCDCGEAHQLARIDWEGSPADVVRCPRCLNYFFSAPVSQLVFGKKLETSVPGYCSTMNGDSWLDVFDLVDFFDWD